MVSDFTGQELACLLKRENRSIRCLYRLTIYKCLDRKGLVLALRELRLGCFAFLMES